MTSATSTRFTGQLHLSTRARSPASALLLTLLWLGPAGCSTTPRPTDPARANVQITPQQIARPPWAGLRQPQAHREASAAFQRTWGDGRAEIAGYSLTTPRYGAPRQGIAVLIFVTEPMDATRWVKDDQARGQRRIQVIKLNQMQHFRTGIYPYSVMTSVFSPVSARGREPFAPAKISISAQEWCGHVYHQLWPKAHHLLSTLHSYFASEGDRSEVIPTAEHTLYEDALLIQLRELDGPFLNGRSRWSGQMVPSVWLARKLHQPLRPQAAQITRSQIERDGVRLTRFVLRVGQRQRTVDVEREPPRRIVAWSGNDGERAQLLRSRRLPYWKLNGPGDERYLQELGLPPPRELPGPQPSTRPAPEESTARP